MKKEREYKYDNIKAMLIFFVVFGHLLEMLSGNVSNKIYIFIYTFHMPIFIYISGYFSKGNMKSIAKFTYIYLIWQTISYLFDVIILKTKINFSLTLPTWTLWYVFAMIFWNLIIKFLDKILVKNYLYILMCSFIISLLVGFCDKIGYRFSASRIITFFPYFLLGYINKNIKIKNSKLAIYSNWIIGVVSIITTTYFIVNINIIKPTWLYGSYSYGKGRI